MMMSVTLSAISRYRASLATVASKAASAAILPVEMALWLPFSRGTFTKPAEQPIRAPPGKIRVGMDWNPPSLIARAP